MSHETTTLAGRIQQSWDRLCLKVSRNTTDNALIKSKMSIMIVVGIVMCFMAAYTVYQERFVYSRWTPTTAQVVSIDAFTAQGRKKPEEHYRYTLRYSDGQREWTKTRETPAKPRFGAGQQVPVTFDPADTQSFRLNFGDANEFALFVFILGSAFIVFPGFIIYKKEGRPELPMRRKIFLVGCGLFFASMASTLLDKDLAILFLTFSILLIPPSLALLVKDKIADRIRRSRQSDPAARPSIERKRPLK